MYVHPYVSIKLSLSKLIIAKVENDDGVKATIFHTYHIVVHHVEYLIIACIRLLYI